MIKAVLPSMRQRRVGHIVNVTSMGGFITMPGIAFYCGSKFALEGFSEALSYELASQGVRVKLVDPHGGVTSTRFNARSAESAATSDTLKDYDSFVARTNDAFANLAAASNITAGEVAHVIHAAATDGTDRLRYLVGDDDRGFIKARRTLDDQEYLDFMRARFPSA